MSLLARSLLSTLLALSLTACELIVNFTPLRDAGVRADAQTQAPDGAAQDGADATTDAQIVADATAPSVTEDAGDPVVPDAAVDAGPAAVLDAEAAVDLPRDAGVDGGGGAMQPTGDASASDDLDAAGPAPDAMPAVGATGPEAGSPVDAAGAADGAADSAVSDAGDPDGGASDAAVEAGAPSM